MKLPPMPQVRLDQFAIHGGMDQITPPLALKPGIVRNASNFEASSYGGYSRIKGYERFDGHPSPSAGLTTLVYVATVLSAPAVGDTLTDPVAGGSGVIAKIEAGYFVLTKVTGVFTIGNSAKVGATVIGTITAATGPVTPQEQAQHLAAAADIYRADISAVPGSGPVRGGFILNDVIYAFRDNAGGTATVLYKSSATGWTAVSFFYEISFTAGSNKPAEGDTLTQGGVTATIKRVVTESGYNVATGVWTAGSAAGRLIISAPAGGSFAAGAATGSGGMTATLSGAETAITMAPGGRFEAVKANFAGGTSTARVYGCDGVNRTFEFDGTLFVPISLGLGSADKPKHIVAHKTILFLAVGSSVFAQVPGWPYDASAANGATEFALGENVTGMIQAPGAQTTATLFIFMRSNTSILYGTNSADWNLVSYNTGVGALDYSVQNMAQTLALDDRGANSIQTTLSFGNFDQTTLTFQIRPFIEAHGNAVVCSTLDRAKSQYRLFFSDKYGLYITLVNGKLLGCMPVYLDCVPFSSFQDKLSTGEEVQFIGAQDGYLYQLEKGTSFDGVNIYAFLTFIYNPSGNVRLLKSYRKAAIEIQGNAYAAFSFGYSLGYDSTDIVQPSNVNYDTGFSTPLWDSFTWDNFTWDGRSLIPSECNMAGTAENVALTVIADANYYDQFTFNSMTIHYLPRRLLR